MGKHPVATPQLADEGMAILECDLALRRLANVRDDVFRFDRVAFDQLGHGRGNR